jgi:endonuclease/exonuclease/phosphatase (EEP) superfamily protein YafD
MGGCRKSDIRLIVWVVGMKVKLKKYLVFLSDLVFVLFFLWFSFSFFTHGRFAWVSLANMFAVYIFLLLTPFALLGIFQGIRRIQVASLIALGLFLFTFGKFFLPKAKQFSPSEDVLKVMTYNMLVHTPEIPAVADMIREENADIVFIQETSFSLMEYMSGEMEDVYPFQIHFPSENPNGISVASKYPFEVLDYDMGKSWMGDPILLDVDWNGQPIYVVNFHMQSTSAEMILDLDFINKRSKSRERHARKIDRFLFEHPGPAIVAGDVNDVFLNDVYYALAEAGLRDSWLEAGFGLGHTFPGNRSPGTSRPKVVGLYIPEWLVRIDYIFVTRDWEVLAAYTADTDGYSDHRGVVAVLRLK